MLLSKRLFRTAYSLTTLSLLIGLAACNSPDTATETEDGDETAAVDSPDAGVTGDVLVDGSSTVFPISEAMAEEFMAENPDARVTVGVSGSGGGFSKFCAGETDISNASRPIKPEEAEICAENGIEFVELPIAFDGLSVIANPENDWAECLTVDELKMVWEPDAQGTITNWNQIRDEFPDAPLGLYAPGTDSGTFDYFTEAIMGESGASRGDFTSSEDDNVIVQGVASDRGGMGYLGYAYYIENEDRLKLMAIDGGNGCIQPSQETIADGSYQPLSRPEFFYVKVDSLSNPAVRAFAEFQIDPDNANLVNETGYVPIPADLAPLAQERLDEEVTGTVFPDGSAVGVKLADLFEEQ
ncbi:MAG: PstS family phosphate ABC transporter substrate-binding protein [Spirulinaceae cyanobacterium]